MFLVSVEQGYPRTRAPGMDVWTFLLIQIPHQVLAEHGDCVSSCLSRRKQCAMSGVACDAGDPGLVPKER